MPETLLIAAAAVVKNTASSCHQLRQTRTEGEIQNGTHQEGPLLDRSGRSVVVRYNAGHAIQNDGGNPRDLGCSNSRERRERMNKSHLKSNNERRTTVSPKEANSLVQQTTNPR